MGCSGNPLINTPNIDRLAHEGVRFNHAYTSFPLCCPFRASVMTGKYAHSNGMFANHYPIPLDQTFLAEVFRDNGYRTGYIGKWHLDGGIKHGYIPPERRLGFEYFVGFNRGHQYFNSVFYRNDDPTPRMCKRFEPEFQTEHLIEFLDSRDDRPFLAMISYGPPHPPLVMTDHYKNMYNPNDVTIRGNTPDTEKARNFLGPYYGLTTAIDDEVGRILTYLDKNDLSDNTIIYFVSDHGEMAGEHNLSGKRVYHEASMRVPLIVRHPASISGNRVVDHLVDPGIDTMPTLLDLCNIPIPTDVQGVSFAPLLNNSDEPIHDAIHYELLKESEGPEKTPIPQRGVRTHNYLYVRDEDGPVVLFDLQNDPLEKNNLANHADYTSTINELDALLTDHMHRTNDNWAVEAIFPPPNFQTHGEGAQYFEQIVKEAIIEP